MYFFYFSYYGPGTSLFYPMAPAAAAAGIPLTAASPFANANAVGGAGLHAQNLAAAAAAAAAAQQQQNAVLSSAQYQFTASQGALKSSQVASTVSSSSLVSATPVASSNSGSKLGSPAAKKFRPAFARPSHKGSRYIPKPIPQELGNLKTYSKPITYQYFKTVEQTNFELVKCSIVIVVKEMANGSQNVA